jgi:glucose/arabinose dehydrogenase
VPPPVPQAGSSLRFFGTGSGQIDRVSIPLDDPPRPVDVGGDFTVELWMKTAAGNASGGCATGGDNWINGNSIVDRDVFGAGDHGDYGLSLFGTGGRLAFGVAVGATGNTICGSHNVADGAWHHVAATRSATGAMRLFVDGQLDASGSGPAGDVSYADGRATVHPADPFLVIGAEKHDAGASFPSYHGWVDEVRVSNVVRYAGPFATPTAPWSPDASTVGLWHFDEGNGEMIVDSSGAAGQTGTGVRRVGGPSNGPQWSTDVPFASQTPVITLQTLTTALSAPTSIAHAGDTRLFITEQIGTVRIWDGTQLLPTPFVTVPNVSCCGEEGLLSIAFHPDYANNGYFFVYYVNGSGNVEIDRYTRSANNPNLANANSRVPVLTVTHPNSNHNGGQLKFGPDGYLYAGIGDGGGACDDSGAGCNAQNNNLLLGKILRLDVDQLPYTIPPDNPFVGPGAPLDEIWAKGVRNPWRFTFDRLTDSLFIGDVGQGMREEVDLVSAGTPSGRNFGWKMMEGTLCNTCSLTNCGSTPACNAPELTLPILDYSHAGGNCSITGGYVYRGTQVPYLYGKYIFGDLCSGRLWWATQNNGAWTSTLFTATAGQLYTFGQGVDGELYVGQGNGTLSRIR